MDIMKIGIKSADCTSKTRENKDLDSEEKRSLENNVPVEKRGSARNIVTTTKDFVDASHSSEKTAIQQGLKLKENISYTSPSPGCKRGRGRPRKDAKRNAPTMLAAQPLSEFCFFCKKRVYIMERMSAEGIFFHRGCLRCDFCGANLRLTNYSCDRLPAGDVRFYCFRHSKLEMRHNRPRKKRSRDYGDDTTKENIPEVLVEPEPLPIKHLVSPKRSPKKPPPQITPLKVPDEVFEQAKKTPERVEFENSIEGLPEESEEEQVEHNLRASLSSDALLLDMDEDSNSDSDDSLTDYEMAHILGQWSSDDEADFNEVVEDAFNENPNLTWEDALSVAKSWTLRRSQENLLDAMDQENCNVAYKQMKQTETGEEEEDDTETEVEAESDYDSDDETETEEGETNSKTADEQKSSSLSAKKDSLKADNSSGPSAQSPSSPASVMAARAAFFSAPPSVIRLDPWTMFGMGKQENSVSSESHSNEHRISESDPETTDKQVHPHVLDEALNVDGDESPQTPDDVTEEECDEAWEAGDEDSENGIENDVLDDEDGMEDEDEELDKTALSYAMEKILADIDHKSASYSDSCEILKNEVHDGESSECEDDVFMGAVAGDVNEDTEMAVLRSVQDVSDNTAASGDTTLQEVLLSVNDMSEPGEQKMDRELKKIDERFITCTRGKVYKKRKQKKKKKSVDSDSSLTISTPTRSGNSSVSSLSEELAYNQKFISTNSSDEKPDTEMLQDYMLTMSMALDDEDVEEVSNGDSPRDNDNEDQNKTLQGESFQEESLEFFKDAQDRVSSDFPSLNNSVYATPNCSMTEQNSREDGRHSESYSARNVNNECSLSPTDINKDTCRENEGVTTTSPTENSWKPLVNSPQVQLTKIESPKQKSPKDIIAPVTFSPHSPGDLTFSKVPKQETNKNSESSASSVSETRLTSDGQSSKPGTGRKLPEIRNLKSKCTGSFQSEFMKNKLGSPTASRSADPQVERSTTSPVSILQKEPLFSRPLPEIPQQLTSASEVKYVRPLPVPPGGSATKTKIPVDHAKLVSSSSTGSSDDKSKSAIKKKIALDRSLDKKKKGSSKTDLLENRKSIDEEDIPFADDSEEEVAEKFYTPATSVKQKPPRAPVSKDIRKRILPTPPKKSDEPVMLSPEHIREIKKVEMEKARENARARARLKSDEELGLGNMGYTPNSPVKMGHKLLESSNSESRSSHSNTPSTSDMVTDSDDGYKQRPQALATPVENTTSSEKQKKKSRKSIGDKTPTKSFDRSDSETKSPGKKKRSLLSILIPSKTEKVKEQKDRPSTPSSDGVDDKSGKKKKKTPKLSKSDKKDKKKSKSASPDYLDAALSDNMRDLKIGSMFTGKMSGADKKPGFAVRSLPPKAEVDDFSDSDESMMSTDTTISRRSKSTHLTEEELEARIARKVQSAAKKQAKQKQQLRLRNAQEIQRKLEEVDVKQRELEEKGVGVEMALRGDGEDAGRSESELMQEWFNLVHEKNALVRLESEMMVRAKELELEDRQGRLEQQIRENMAVSESKKSEEELLAEKRIFDEYLEVVQQRDSLVAMLEEDRVREQEEDRDLRTIMNRKGFMLSPLDQHTQFIAGLPRS